MVFHENDYEIFALQTIVGHPVCFGSWNKEGNIVDILC